MIDDPKALTPIEQRGDVWVKRDDKFVIAGVPGGKVRTCWHLSQGAKGLVTAGSRASPQVNIVAHIARHLGVPCRVHTPEGELSPEVLAAKAAGAEVVQHRAGYNSVIIARARDDAKARGWTEIPFGMDCQEAVEQTRKQVASLIPLVDKIKRIVVPVGSGMSLSGILHGMLDYNIRIPVLGVAVGADPIKRLETYAPQSNDEDLYATGRELAWRDMVEMTRSEYDYHTPFKNPVWRGITLDPVYEAKATPFLKPGDLLWVIGIRQTFVAPDKEYTPS
jgi:1-aminocyclopropane-1-carboxylate deaminase/D-cysteine desulfhydrase-like pyridoxal-dependent ACC family enzyme